MEIAYKDLVLLNGTLKEQDARYHVRYKNREVACIEAPGICCQTREKEEKTRKVIEAYYQTQHRRVVFSPDFLYFRVE